MLYQTAPILLDSIIDYRFGKNDNKDFYDEILNTNLLIIDDLGTESLNSLKFTEIFNIINLILEILICRIFPILIIMYIQMKLTKKNIN